MMTEMSQHTDLLLVARKIRVAGKEIKKLRDQNAQRHGITSNQADALAFIRDNPGCSITVLKEEIGTSHQAACGLADRLISKGLVEAGTSDDARVKTLALSSNGEELLREFFSVGIEDNVQLFEGLSDEELAQLDKAMDRIIERLHRRAWRHRRRAVLFNASIPSPRRITCRLES